MYVCGLLIFRQNDGYKSFTDIAFTEMPDRVELIQDAWGVVGFRESELNDSQLAVLSGKMQKRHNWQYAADPQGRADHPVWTRFWMSLWGAAIEAIAMSWGVPLPTVLENSELDNDKHFDDEGNKLHFSVTRFTAEASGRNFLNTPAA